MLRLTTLRSSSGGGDRRRQGWVLNEDGTWVRGRTSTSSHSSETHYGGGGRGGGGAGGGAGGNEVKVGGGGHEGGDVGHNTTGWVRQPDGTMIKTTSSWSSWSKTSASDADAGEMERVRGQLEQKARDRLRSVQGRSSQCNSEQWEMGRKILKCT